MLKMSGRVLVFLLSLSGLISTLSIPVASGRSVVSRDPLVCNAHLQTDIALSMSSIDTNRAIGVAEGSGQVSAVSVGYARSFNLVYFTSPLTKSASSLQSTVSSWCSPSAVKVNML